MIPEEIAAYIEANGLGSVDTDLFYAGLPETPDSAAAIWEYGGEESLRVKNGPKPVREYPRFQIIVRAKSYIAARLRAEQIYRLLDGFKGEINGVGYASINALQPPFFLDRDDKTRTRIVCNYKTAKERSPLA